ncbi:HK97 family phage prohead protease [Rhodococcus tibetensis]|uniref:HK97 family phage prohead protease n=1 Tax=Rhodococcus tibetensis TaxID=2965064 RepID=A0ABT1QDZ4_9NOCA|nr:HK97 family phage prohead protease [Rhodococcus sp. FXJ9.536]MCQ4119878.1 HK97 family phage prohead protease [Rhodococcus sp. FXJ9.536]
MLTKNCAPVRVKAGTDDGLEDGEFTAYASVFGNKDSYGDIVMPGAFADTLADWAKSGDPIPLLFGHNMSDPDYNIGHILSAEEDEIGLKVHAKLDLEGPKALQVYRLIKGRRVSQMSFAYDVLGGGYAEREKADDSGETEGYYELRKLKLYEVSVVPIGANQETDILAVKSIPALADRIVEDAKAGRVISAKNESELRTAHESIGRVLSVLDSTDEEKASGKPADTARPEDQGPAEKQANPSVNPLAALEALALAIELSA